MITRVRSAILLILLFIVILWIVLISRSTEQNNAVNDGGTNDTDIGHLIQEIKSTDPHKQANAFRELDSLGWRAAPAIPDLINMLGDDNAQSHLGAYALLKQLGTFSVTPLINDLSNREYPRHLFMVIALLGKIGDHRAVEPITPFLNDKDPDIRVASSLALWDMPDLRAFESLLKALKDENAEVRENAVAALGQLQDARAAKSMLDLFLKDPDKRVKARAARCLGQLKYYPAVDELIKGIPKCDVEHRDLEIAIVEALGELGDPKALAPLTEIMANREGDLFIRRCTGYALGKLHPDQHAVDALVHVWKNPNEDVALRSIAAMALGYTRDIRAVEGLKYALENGDYSCRTIVVKLLGEGGDIERYDLLKDIATKDRDGTIRLYADYILKAQHASQE
jgi:HEAT repeat protein